MPTNLRLIDSHHAPFQCIHFLNMAFFLVLLTFVMLNLSMYDWAIELVLYCITVIQASISTFLNAKIARF